jgi:hypothetical protein
MERASHRDELIEEPQRLGLVALALTDRDGVYSIVRAYVKVRKLGVRLIVGSQVAVEDESVVIPRPVRLCESLPAFDGGPVALRKSRERGHVGRNSPACERVAFGAASKL